MHLRDLGAQGSGPSIRASEEALAMTGDAAATDPACARAPDHGLMARAIEASIGASLELVPRRLQGAQADD